MVKALREAANGSTLTPLMDAVISENVELIKALLYVGASPDTEGVGQTPLTAAISCGNMDVIEVLLKAGASLEAEDASSNTRRSGPPYSTGMWRWCKR